MTADRAGESAPPPEGPAPVPHLVPYQGSKRRLAPEILATLGGRQFGQIIEPFSGSAAITLAAAARDLGRSYLLGDSLRPLAALWAMAVEQPDRLADGYARLWQAQHADPRAHFLQVRAEYNGDGDPARLLYLLCRCVKNAPRFNARGGFNQSADHRRPGMRPEKVRAQAHAVSRLLRGRVEVHAGDFRRLLDRAGRADLVYLDPPWAGTTDGRDKRYHAGLPTEHLIVALRGLVARGVPFLLSYDGRTGDKRFGPDLPADIGLHKVEITAGRSSQATLLGRAAETVESLYLSPALLHG